MLRALAVVATLLLAGCSAWTGAAPVGPADPAAPRTGAVSPEVAGGLDDLRRQRYVAMGDSFTAAPLVPVTDVARGCLRSDGNYPSLLAEALDLRLTDVSCSGATTRHLVHRQRTTPDASVAPQLRALDSRTDLVTVGIGGNDLGLFGTLVRTCLGLRAGDPAGSPCADSEVGQRLAAALPQIGENVERALDRVAARAPDARVVLVGYPRIAPAEGTCPGRLPLARGDVAFGDRVLRGLDRELREAALTAGAEYLDLYAASAGHDVCSSEPWVNGRHTQGGVALAFHPLAAGARATAALLEDLLGP